MRAGCRLVFIASSTGQNTPLAGMVSIGDLVKSIIGDQKFTIEQLNQYIGDKPV